MTRRDHAGPQTSKLEIVLAVRNLTTTFAGRDGIVTAVRDVSLDLHRMEKMGIVGESGCGKSALALSILGLIERPGRVTHGSVRLNGREIRNLGDRALDRVRGREIALVFQDPTSSLDPVKTIGGQVAEALRRHRPANGRKEIRQRVLQLLEEVEIPDAARRARAYPHQYSGGMRQRVTIAIALANDPDVVIADEPTTALDVTTQAQILALLDRLVREHQIAVVLITHNIGLIAEFCDTVQVMYAGRIVERGAMPAFFANPLHPYSEALLASVPRPDRQPGTPLPSITGSPPSLTVEMPGCPFEPRCFYGHGREVCRAQFPEMTPSVFDPERIAECHFVRERSDRSYTGER